MTIFMKKARPVLIESGKILLKTTADVLTQPRPGEKFKSKLTRIMKQTGSEIMYHYLLQPQKQLPLAKSGY